MYLLTFERMTISYGVKKAQQAYVAMPTTEAGQYDQVKAAILRRYDINAETYWQRFREATRKGEESYHERWHS